MTNSPLTRQTTGTGGVSPVFLLILAVFIGAGVELGVGRGGQIGTFVFVFVGWLVSLCLHEWAHAASAYAGGDRSVSERGYLTLNPLKYANPFLSIVMPLLILAAGGIGFPGGAVYLHKDALRNKWWRAGVSAAGPFMNLAILIVCGLLIRFAPINETLAGAIAFLALIQGTAFVLNMLPVPGLDGFGVLESFFPPHERAMLAPLANIASLIFFVLLISAPMLFIPIFNVAQMVCNWLGVPDVYMQSGYEQFHFWS
ncbi:MAG: site-2 protease family protein [Terricaulis sp.]